VKITMDMGLDRVIRRGEQHEHDGRHKLSQGRGIPRLALANNQLHGSSQKTMAEEYGLSCAIAMSRYEAAVTKTSDLASKQMH
jgi:hypothetical protein